MSVPLPSQMPSLQQQEPKKPEPPDYVPLAKVKDEIRKRIALQKPGMAAQRLLDPLRKEMSGHTVTVTQRVAKPEGRPAEMAKFDLAKKAAALKLEVKRLEMVSAGDVAMRLDLRTLRRYGVREVPSLRWTLLSSAGVPGGAATVTARRRPDALHLSARLAPREMLLGESPPS